MRKEKYIVERKAKKFHYLQVAIDFRDESKKRKTWSQNINVAEYPSPAEAMKTAIAIRDQALRDISTGKAVSHIPTVEELFLDTREMFSITVKTWERKSFLYEKGIAELGSMPITKITAGDLQKHMSKISSTQSTDQARRVLSVWRQIYKCALLKGVPVVDYSQIVVLPKSKALPETKKSVIISGKDFFAFIDYLKRTSARQSSRIGMHRRIRIIYLLQIMFYTGLRPAEVLALTRDDIDVEKRLLHVTKSVGCNFQNTRQIVPAKTPQSVRAIPISDALLQVIKEMLGVIPDHELFYDHDGKPMEIDMLSTYVHRNAVNSGIKINMYMLRHTMVHDMRIANVAPRVQQDILGHAGFNMTVSYDRSTQEEMKDAVNRRAKSAKKV